MDWTMLRGAASRAVSQHPSWTSSGVIGYLAVLAQHPSWLSLSPIPCSCVHYPNIGGSFRFKCLSWSEVQYYLILCVLTIVGRQRQRTCTVENEQRHTLRFSGLSHPKAKAPQITSHLHPILGSWLLPGQVLLTSGHLQHESTDGRPLHLSAFCLSLILK